VWAEGGRLRCNAPAGTLTPELKEELRQRKEEILEFLRSADSLARQQRAIVPLQTGGTKTPAFAVAGHNGDVFCFRTFVQHLGTDQPFYGLQPPGLDGHSEPLTQVEALAEYFAGQIRAFQPQSPYLIVGYCAGGTIAFELARQLLLAGAAVEDLVLLGAPYPTSYRPLPRLRQLLDGQMERMVKHARMLGTLPLRQKWGYLNEKISLHRNRPKPQLLESPDPMLTHRTKVEEATLAAIPRYTPGHYDGHMSLLLPSRKWTRSGVSARRWRHHAAHFDECFGPEGCHTDIMLRDQYASIFAELFRDRGSRNGQPSPERAREPQPDLRTVQASSL
jgi:thioesterase domain-containing protein